MPRPAKSDSAVTRARLLVAAEAEFGKVGYDRARLEDIAAAAGIRRSSLLYHFGSKETLYRDVVARLNAELRAGLGAALAAPGTAEARLEAAGEVLIRFAESHRAGVAMFVRELLDAPAAGADHMRELLSIVESLETFVANEAPHLLPPGAPVRAVLLHIITAQALRVASGSLGELLWGEAFDPRAIARALLTQRYP